MKLFEMNVKLTNREGWVSIYATSFESAVKKFNVRFPTYKLQYVVIRA